jgi:hypothetical protein
VLDAEVGAVADGVLGDEDDLLRTPADKVDNLLQHVERALAHLRALDAGNGAEGAGVVAAVSHFHVGGGTGLSWAERRQHPFAAGDFRLRRLAEQIADHIADAVPLAGRQHTIDTGGDGVGVVAERGHAPGGDHHLPILAPVEQF